MSPADAFIYNSVRTRRDTGMPEEARHSIARLDPSGASAKRGSICEMGYPGGASGEELNTCLRGRFAGFTLPRDLVLVEELPRCASGQGTMPNWRRQFRLEPV